MTGFMEKNVHSIYSSYADTFVNFNDTIDLKFLLLREKKSMKISLSLGVEVK